MKLEVHESLAGNCPECKRLWDEAESVKAERDRLTRSNDDLRGDNQAHFLKINELQKECYQLRAEVDRLNLLNADLKVTVLENDEFWIKECEKLADGLCRAIQWVEIEPVNKEGGDWNSLAVARQALAEYREKFGEKK